MAGPEYKRVYRVALGTGFPLVGTFSDVQVGDILVFCQDCFRTRMVSSVHKGFVFTHPLWDESPTVGVKEEPPPGSPLLDLSDFLGG